MVSFKVSKLVLLPRNPFKDNIDILVITETKIDHSFQSSQFHKEHFTLFRLDRNKFGGGIMANVRWNNGDIPCKQIYVNGYWMPIGLDLHKCLICNKVLPSKSSFKRHLRIHTSEKPFACSDFHKCLICNEVLTSVSGLKRHLRIHTSEKSFACSECECKFKHP